MAAPDLIKSEGSWGSPVDAGQLSQIEELSYFIQQSTLLYEKDIGLRTQLMQPHNEFEGKLICDQLDANAEEIQALFSKYHTLFQLPRELLVPFESAITDMVIKFTKMQALSMNQRGILPY